MAYNDYLVILYKIMKYVDEAQKAGKPADIYEMPHILGFDNIPDSYWQQVLATAKDEGYLVGVECEPVKPAGYAVLATDLRLTIYGAEYLSENSGMQKAAKYLGPAFRDLLTAVMSGAVQNMF